MIKINNNIENREKSDKLNVASTPRASDGNLTSVDGNFQQQGCVETADQVGSYYILFKDPLSIDELYNHFLSENKYHVKKNEDIIIKNYFLEHNYYRLRGYWFFLTENNVFDNEVSFENVIEIYKFDIELRHLIFEMIEKVEIKFRSLFAYYSSNELGANVLYDDQLYIDKDKYFDTLAKVKDSISKAKYRNLPCIRHNLKKHGKLPIWAAVEVLSFGTISKLYNNINSKNIHKNVAKHFNLSFKYFKNWMLHLNTIRNMCAHYERLYCSKTKQPPLKFKN